MPSPLASANERGYTWYTTAVRRQSLAAEVREPAGAAAAADSRPVSSAVRSAKTSFAVVDPMVTRDVPSCGWWLWL